MIRAILIVAAIAATTLALSKGGAHADSLNIHQATLAEANQKTQEVSTEQLRRILADGSVKALGADLSSPAEDAGDFDEHFRRMAGWCWWRARAGPIRWPWPRRPASSGRRWGS